MKYLIVSFILICNVCLAQKPASKTKKTSTAAKPAAAPQKKVSEWDELDKTFIAFVAALENKDKAAYTALSLKQVDCAECPGGGEQGSYSHFVPAEVFYITVAEDFKKSPVYKALAKRGYAFNTMVLKDFKLSFLPKDTSNDLKVYEVWVQTYKPDELSKGHIGTNHAFQFVKVNGSFKFFGLTSQ
ncbi:hypothetical protein R1T16_00605 [Flavobacterium sp. DG1-102-2]|uniref:hypothetical protein n=1 Tax=Flavobacterium sp. DG1-102-2 TaxID=3081663 RepID=UPI00294A6904|nr:hypothetical protein [Flavobacterium sp. DG1-102-2]MDV6166905.1 hypothetical protein [Flavobacterium sp. DG1-102-2]